uniref:Uncharacterized protein n=1 Tax=Ananas comosus var. bracteatus TaxID=296719 RepID=A0A6V7PB55_ANACO|nr:unnamed protein product [Ananas comosus var. bracteatus]
MYSSLNLSLFLKYFIKVTPRYCELLDLGHRRLFFTCCCAFTVLCPKARSIRRESPEDGGATAAEDHAASSRPAPSRPHPPPRTPLPFPPPLHRPRLGVPQVAPRNLHALASAAADALVVEDFEDQFAGGPKTKDFVAAMRRWGSTPSRRTEEGSKRRRGRDRSGGRRGAIEAAGKDEIDGGRGRCGGGGGGAAAEEGGGGGGGTAAECAAVCCCCPCAVVDLLVLAVVRLPAGICRRALRARASAPPSSATAMVGARKRKAPLLSPESSAAAAAAVGGGGGAEVVVVVVAVAEVEEEMEKEMWAKFYGAGFWRSPSQREDER